MKGKSGTTVIPTSATEGTAEDEVACGAARDAGNNGGTGDASIAARIISNDDTPVSLGGAVTPQELIQLHLDALK
jgi:hypothetical protein